MKKTAVVFAVKIFTLLLASCSSSEEPEVDFDYSSAPVKKITGEKILDNSVVGTISHITINNNVLYVNAYFQSEDSLITVIGLENEEINGYLLRKGDGPNEANMAWNLQAYGAFLSFEDANRQNAYLYSLNERSLEKFKTAGITPDFAVRLEDFVLAKSLHPFNGQHKMSMAKVVDGEITKSLLPFPAVRRDEVSEKYPIDSILAFMAYQAHVSVKRDGRKAAIGYKHMDRITFIGLDDMSALKHIDGPEGYDPVFVSESVGNGTAPVAVVDKNKSAYLSLSSSDDYLYALYSGLPSDPSQEIPFSTKVFMFDWEDYSMDKIYGLAPSPNVIAVSENDSYIVGVVIDEDFALYKYDLSE